MRPVVPALLALGASACGFSIGPSGGGADDVMGDDAGPIACKGSSWRDAAWKSRYPLSVQHARVTGAPGELVVPVVLTSADLMRARADGADLVFTALDGTTTLPFELEAFDATRGALVAWVKLPLSSATDTRFFLYFDNADATAIKPPDPWGDYLAVWHFHNDPIGVTPSIADSTANGNHAAATGFEPADKIPGKLDTAWRFDGANNAATLNPFIHPAQFTIEGWIRPAAITGYHTLVDNSLNRRWFGIFTSSTNLGIDYYDGADHPANVPITLNAWHHVVASYIGSQLRYYLDGTQIGNTLTLALPAQMAMLQIGFSNLGERMNGGVDELRIRTSGLQDDEVLTSYSAQSAPDQFIKPGSLEACR